MGARRKIKLRTLVALATTAVGLWALLGLEAHWQDELNQATAHIELVWDLELARLQERARQLVLARQTEAQKQAVVALAQVLENAQRQPPRRSKRRLSKLEVLSDSLQRIGQNFQIEGGLWTRVKFWYEVYTRYLNTEHVFHHKDYPWIVYEVVDTAPILNGPEHKWTKHAKAEREIQAKTEHLQKLLANLGKKKPSRLNKEERRLYNALQKIPGPKKEIISNAAERLRSQLGQREYFVSAIEKGHAFFPSMEQIFKSHDLPTELTRIPLVESSFDHQAHSKAGAVGVWQIMPYIGQSFMRVEPDLDERRSVLKSTFVAAQLLKENYQILGSWPLAVTAYNHGPGGVRRGIKVAKSRSLAKIIERYDHDRFGFASENYYAGFLAALHAEKYHDQVFTELEFQEPKVLQPYMVPSALTLKALAQLKGVEPSEIQELNPDIRVTESNPDPLLPGGYTLFVPRDEPSPQKTKAKTPLRTESKSKTVAPQSSRAAARSKGKRPPERSPSDTGKKKKSKAREKARPS